MSSGNSPAPASRPAFPAEAECRVAEVGGQASLRSSSARRSGEAACIRRRCRGRSHGADRRGRSLRDSRQSDRERRAVRKIVGPRRCFRNGRRRDHDRVADDGPGIAGRRQGSRPCRAAFSSTATAAAAVLGLAIVSDIVEAYGGTPDDDRRHTGPDRHDLPAAAGVDGSPLRQSRGRSRPLSSSGERPSLAACGAAPSPSPAGPEM